MPALRQAVVLPLNTPHRGLDYLVELARKIRPANSKRIKQVEAAGYTEVRWPEVSRLDFFSVVRDR